MLAYHFENPTFRQLTGPIDWWLSPTVAIRRTPKSCDEISTQANRAIEHAATERGLLILTRGTELRVEAEATTAREGILAKASLKKASEDEVFCRTDRVCSEASGGGRLLEWHWASRLFKFKWGN